MSTSSSKPRSFKRLSLLQSPTSLSSPSSSSFGSPDVASKHFDLPNECAGAAERFPVHTVSSPTTSSHACHAATKNARRQSSIYYVSQDRDVERPAKDVRSPVSERRFSAPLNKNDDDNARSEVKVKRRSLGVVNEQPVPVTLAEKHADLLRFIAQKESRCLELRSQLATEEAELLALKRKWERIVNRQDKGGSSASASSLDIELPAQGAMLTGFKEVGRLLAQLGDLGVQNKETDPGHASNSSVSTTVTVTSSSSTRLSQSSMSSLGMVEDECSADFANVTSDALDNRAKRHSLSSAVRRRPYEPSSPSSPSPPILTPQTPLSASFGYNQTSTPKPPTGTVKTQPKHMKRLSAATGSYPPASSIPGVSVAPLASWVEGVGKRLIDQVSSGSGSDSKSYTTAQSVQKRASTLLSDASNSFFAALTSPTRSSQSGSYVIDLSTPDSPSLLDDGDMLGDGPEVQWAGMAALSPDRPKLVPMKIPSAREDKGAMMGNEGKVNDDNATAVDDDGEEWNW